MSQDISQHGKAAETEMREFTGEEADATPMESIHQEIDPATRRRILWKLDLFVLPLCASVYFFAAMGRSDLANAKIAGMSQELNLSPRDYSNAATTFLISYLLFQLPGTLLVKKIGPPIQFSGAMILWGFLTTMSIFIKSKSHLLALRFLIGIAEAFVQGAVFYLSFFYEYGELATRGAIFSSMSTLAGAFNGLIAYAIAKNLDGANGWRAWRWIFLIEGVAPIAFSFVVLALLPSSPETVRFGFTAAEKEELIRRARRTHNTSESKIDIKQIPKVFLSMHFWLFLIIGCANHFCLSALSNFLPDIILGFGYTEVNAQLFTVIVYACAFVGTIFWARVADKTNARALVLSVSLFGAILGYALLIGLTGRNARFAATCIVAFSMFPNVVLQLSWATMCFAGYTRRGSVIALFNVFSQMFAISGNQAYTDPPYYRTGHSAALGLTIAAAVVSFILRWYLAYLNEVKKKAQNSEESAELRQKSIDEIGDRHPALEDFFYIF